jgi:hypothetical protein
MGELEFEEMIRLQHGVLSRQDAVSAGLSDDAIRWRLESKRWAPLRRGLYVDPRRRTWLSEVRAATAASRGVASHRTAASLLGMDGFDHQRLVEVTSNRRPRSLEGAVHHRTRSLPYEPMLVAGDIPVSPPWATLLELGTVARLEDVEAAVDWAVRKQWVTWPQLEALARRFSRKGARGPVKLRELLHLRGPDHCHTDSLLETRLLQLVRRAGLPTPVLQLAITDGGRIIARADFAWPERKVLVECLGKLAHRAHDAQLTRDCARGNALSLLRQYTVLQFSWHQVMRQQALVLRTLRQALG